MISLALFLLLGQVNHTPATPHTDSGKASMVDVYYYLAETNQHACRYGERTENSAEFGTTCHHLESTENSPVIPSATLSPQSGENQHYEHVHAAPPAAKADTNPGDLDLVPFGFAPDPAPQPEPATPTPDAKGIVWANDGFYYCAKDRGYCLMPTNAEIIAHESPQPCDITSLGGDCGYLFREAHAKQ